MKHLHSARVSLSCLIASMAFLVSGVSHSWGANVFRDLSEISWRDRTTFTPWTGDNAYLWFDPTATASNRQLGWIQFMAVGGTPGLGLFFYQREPLADQRNVYAYGFDDPEGVTAWWAGGGHSLHAFAEGSTVSGENTYLYPSAYRLMTAPYFTIVGSSPIVLIEGVTLDTPFYLGYKFIHKEAVHYGWVNVTLNELDFSLTLNSMGYNDTPGMAAIVGPIPEPASLALFGFAGLGMWAWRRRRLVAAKR